MNITQQTKAKISALVSGAAEGLAGLAEFTVEIPATAANGDFSCNAALVSAKSLKLPPRKIAEMIVERIDSGGFAKIETAGPGFINFFMGADWYSQAVREILAADGDYGRTDCGREPCGRQKRVLLEFVSANPTGPMHIGNARGGALGDCLASLLQYAGYYTEREFYVNDAGNQIEKFAMSLDVRYRQELGEDIEIPEEAYRGEDIIRHAKNYIAIHGRDKRAAPAELAEYALPLNIQALEDDLGKYRIRYDNWFRESTLHDSGAVAGIIEMLKAKGVTYEQDGALFLKSTDFGDEKDRVLVRSNGVVTYIVPDIAYHYNKLVERGFDTAIDIFGADHHGYTARMNAAMSALGVDESRLKMIIMQMVRLVRDGETVKLSKRSGKAITLNTLLDEVPVDAARFFFNLRDANTHLDFDLDLAIEETSKNPVYYVQYAHARTCNVIKRLREESALTLDRIPPELAFSHEAEHNLIRKLAVFPEEIAAAARSLDPSRLTRFAAETAAVFHTFYEKCKIKGQEECVALPRLALVEAARIVLRNVLGILKVDAPERM
jgi:arginyl-tRNA synthetase